MKKLYLFLATLFTCTLAQGQIYFFEGFGSGYWPPQGWTFFPLESWTLSPTDNAGGILPEAYLEGFNYTGTVRLLSPRIDVTDADTLLLSFRYFPMVNMADAPHLGVSTRTGSIPWNVVWETTLQNSNEPREFEVLITDDNLGSSDFQFSLFLEGDISKLDNFYLDNIKLYYPTGTDGKLDEILTPAHVELPEPVIATVRNLGNTIITEVQVTWLTNMGVRHDSLFTGLCLGMGDCFTFQFDRWWVSPFGDYDLKMWISTVNGKEDPYHLNDTLIKSINYSKHPRPMRAPCFEAFSSSTCGACADMEEAFTPWWENHPDIVYTYFPMPFPGAGDPYYTQDVWQRLAYYDIEWIPQTYINGAYAYNVDTSVLAAPYDSALALHSDFIINSSFKIVYHNIIINNYIYPYESVSGARVHTMLLEKTTTGNVGSNGITEFHNVLMKAFPNGGEGDPVDFGNGFPYSKTFTANLEETNIEEYDDLMVAVYIQHDLSKAILQSVYSIENGEFSTEDRLSMIMLDGEPLEGFDPDIYSYDVELPLSAIESPVVFGTLMHENAMMVIGQAYLLPGQAVIDVYSESRGTMKRYIVNLSLTTDIENPEVLTIGVFPNPVVNGKLFLTGIEGTSARLFALDGKLILNIEEHIDNTIDLSGVKTGVYILSLTDKKGGVVRKKIVVM